MLSKYYYKHLQVHSKYPSINCRYVQMLRNVSLFSFFPFLLVNRLEILHRYHNCIYPTQHIPELERFPNFPREVTV